MKSTCIKIMGYFFVSITCSMYAMNPQEFAMQDLAEMETISKSDTPSVNVIVQMEPNNPYLQKMYHNGSSWFDYILKQVDQYSEHEMKKALILVTSKYRSLYAAELPKNPRLCELKEHYENLINFFTEKLNQLNYCSACVVGDEIFVN